MKTNFHTHTKRCKHGFGTASDYADAALAAGMDILGFSEHAPFPDHDYGYRMDYEEFPEYLQEIADLKASLKGKLRIYTGLEIEYMEEYLPYYLSLKENPQMDFLALGEHFFHMPSGVLRNIFSAESTHDYVEYAYAIEEALSTGLFPMLVHPDVMFINDFAWDKNCDKACEIILQAAEKHNTILECNANGLRRGIMSFPDGDRSPYPHPRFWQRLSGSPLRVIVGSDAHAPEQVRDEAVLRAEELCAGWNLHMIETIFGSSGKEETV